MDYFLWAYTEEGKVVCVDFPDGDENYLADVYPNCIYFFAGAAPLPLED